MSLCVEDGEEGVGKEALCTYRIGKKVERGERGLKSRTELRKYFIEDPSC